MLEKFTSSELCHYNTYRLWQRKSWACVVLQFIYLTTKSVLHPLKRESNIKRPP